MLRSWISWRLGCTGKPASTMAKGSTVGPLSLTIQDHHSLTNNQYLSLSKAGSFSAVIFSSSESGLTFTNWKDRDWVESNISAHILLRVIQLQRRTALPSLSSPGASSQYHMCTDCSSSQGHRRWAGLGSITSQGCPRSMDQY